jgi:DNA modification methylase
MTDLRIITADVLDGLAQLEDESVQCVCTSPPYWGLRDYGIDGQLGLERTPEEYVEKMVVVFREVRRVLRSDGVVWLNLGDCYHSGNRGGYRKDSHRWENCPMQSKAKGSHLEAVSPNRLPQIGLKDKDLVGMPWRLAFALQADGWWLRSDIIWSKPNPMPESVTDRPTKAHEYVFLLTKSARYFYDADAVREPIATAPNAQSRGSKDTPDRGPREGGNTGLHKTAMAMRDGEHAGRNLRTVWTIPTEPYPEAHFATFPTTLPERCIRAGTSEWGCCAECGAPLERVVERERCFDGKPGVTGSFRKTSHAPEIRSPGPEGIAHDRFSSHSTTVGWQPTCTHDAPRVPCTVLDPFAGSGTTLMVARGLGRNAIGIELNPEYVELAERRCALPWERTAKADDEQLDLFAVEEKAS